MPHPAKMVSSKRKKHKKKFKSNKPGDSKRDSSKFKSQSMAVILLQNASLDLRFIFQRKASDGTIKTISIETFFKKLDIFMTENQYFDLNYWIAALLYAQAQQYAFENPHLTKDFEPSISNSYSITAQSQTQSQSNIKIKSSTDSKDNKESKDDDEDKDAVESHHLSAGKLLFDALSLCQPPRFQWNVCIHTNVLRMI